MLFLHALHGMFLMLGMVSESIGRVTNVKCEAHTHTCIHSFIAGI